MVLKTENTEQVHVAPLYRSTNNDIFIDKHCENMNNKQEYNKYRSINRDSISCY